MKNFRKTNYYNDDTHYCDLKRNFEKIMPNKKTHFNNVESVSFNVINGVEKKERREKGCKDEFVTEHYVLSVNDAKDYASMNVSKLKRVLAQEGVHIHKDVKESGNVLNNRNGKFYFEIRRGKGGDDEKDNKLQKIAEFMKGKKYTLEKYEQKQMHTDTKPKGEKRIGEVKSKGNNKRT